MPKRWAMNLLEKIENAVNLFLIKLVELIFKSIPQPVKLIFNKLVGYFEWIVANFKQIPNISKKFLLLLFKNAKSAVKAFNYKAALQETYQKAIAHTKESSPGLGQIKIFFLTPFLIMGQWLKGLSAAQSFLLLTFTTASIISIIGIGYSGKKLVHDQFEMNRLPANTLEEVQYERPDYYKKQTRHFEATNLRLPIYIGEVNEIRSIDIDFTATMSNRNSRNFLQKNEFPLRDHLILQVEPSVATFPLIEEGKEIIRKKILNEINDFLKLNEVEGEVVELKITYVLAN